MLKRYKPNNSRSSLTLYVHSPKPSPFHKYYNSYRQPVLIPLSAETPDPINENVPICDDNIPTTLISHQSSRPNEEDMILEKLPIIPSPNATNFVDIFKQKLVLCSQLCNFDIPTADSSAKEIKLLTLKEVLNFINSVDDLNTPLFNLLLEMLKVNLVRNISQLDPKMSYIDEIPILFMPCWIHIQIIYDILIIAIKRFSEKITFSYMCDYIQMFASFDMNEREKLKTVFISYMTAHPENNDQIFTKFSIYLYNSLEHKHFAYCFSTMISILLYIIRQQKKGQINQVERNIFIPYILPLLSAKNLNYFSNQLISLFDQYVANDEMFAYHIVRETIHCFSQTRVTKQVIMLKILAHYIVLVPEDKVENLIRPALGLFSITSQSECIRVSDTTLTLFLSDPMNTFLDDNSKIIFPIVFPSFFQVMQRHSSQQIRDLAKAAIAKMNRIDNSIVGIISAASQQTQENYGLKNWANIARGAAKRDRTLNLGTKLSEITKLFSVTIKSTFDDTGTQSFILSKKSLLDYPQSSSPQLIAPSIRHLRQF
ncbi:protein phosphatase 2A, regulatory subunit [Tritrichomonas foetus]|uniref:Protein phosphatase 2A, regulatory subunit n=1 Tax=Tritrichomonas foetus TaxID=1144522 RepID=A0A1J4KDN5_9EUKA|nr:protein phosphatase 2A, regulatory subunit [Tritrichomonas foetus]|eukprot:OHT09098.1 protein phosphatase 2A, regulatory subunit [Tritrichomonas foetus]